MNLYKMIAISKQKASTKQDHLFISYASEDGDFAEWLTLKLSAQGYRVWCDRIKLLGGESYPRNIDEAIKSRTFRMLALMSKHSINKGNPVKERTLGHSISHQRKIDFVIPLLLDDTRPDELDWMSSDLTYISFRSNWANGLIQLFKKLDSIETPRPLHEGAQAVRDWVAEQTTIEAKREKLWSNLFEIKSMPEFIYRIQTPRDFNPNGIDWIYYQQVEGVVWSFHVPDPKLKYQAVKWDNTRRLPFGVPPLDMATILIKEHLRRLCIRKKAQETLDGDLFLSTLAAPDGWLRFINYQGKSSRVLVTSQRTVRSTGGVRIPYRYYLSPIFKPVLRKYTVPMVELQIRLYLTDSEGKQLPSRMTNKRRKKITRSWWNYQWISRVWAISQWAFGEAIECNISSQYDYEIILCSTPISTISPIGIGEDPSVPIDVQEEELEAEEDEDDDDWEENEP